MGCVGGFRIEFQTMERRRPLSKFMFGMDFLIWMAFTVLLYQNASARLWTVAPSQLMQWFVFWTWSATPLLGSPRLTACLCSLNMTFSVLLLLPTYISGQSLQGTSYTTPVHFCSGVLFFTCIRPLFRVFIGLKTGCTSRVAQTISIFSLRPLMLGVHRTFGVLSCCGVEAAGKGARWIGRVFFTRVSGMPFAWTTWFRWSISCCIFVG